MLRRKRQSTEPAESIAKPKRLRKPSEQIVAVRTLPVTDDTDAQFVALLRRKCTRAAITGALTASIEAIPGLGRVLGFIFGELLDAQFLARVQRELVEDTFKLYRLELADPLHSEVVSRVQTLGTSASIASDALIRGALKRTVGRISGVVTRRFLPIAAIVSSAVSNASVTYAIGKRAQAVAKWHGAIDGMPDAVRAFSGVDERRILAWSVEAVKTSLGLIGKALKRMLHWPGANRPSGQEK